MQRTEDRRQISATVILFGLLLAQLADAATFIFAVMQLPAAGEANPWMRFAFEAGGTSAVLWVKGASIMVTLVLLAAFAPRFPRLLLFVGATSTSVGILGALTNVAVLLLMGG